MAKGISVTELANMVRGKVVGDLANEIQVSGTCAVDNYDPNKVSFVRKAKYEGMLNQLRNAVVLVPESLAYLCEKYPQNIYIVVKDVLKSMMDLQDFFYKDELLITDEGISPTARIDKSAKIGNQVYIGENVYVGKNVLIGNEVKIMHNSVIFDNVAVGKGTQIYPNVCIYKNCQIGNNCVIHSGVRIGVDGFRFEQDIRQKTVRKWLHVGSVVIGDRVEIGANSTIDRATFQGDDTVLSDDVKIDNQVHIGHNAKVGARTLVAAQTCISGSAHIGEDVWVGAGVTISNGVTVGNRAKVLLNAVVAYDVPEGLIVSGFYAMPHRKWKQVWRQLQEGAQ